MRSDCRSLFFGFDADENEVCVIAVDPWGKLVFLATFPLAEQSDLDLDTGPAAPIAATLAAFADAHEATAMCGFRIRTPLLQALARALGGGLRCVHPHELAASPLRSIAAPWCRSPIQANALRYALLAALACHGVRP
jgi:hypothetical protein